MNRTVRDVMTTTVVVVSESAPFKEIVRTMDEYRVSALPVVDEDGGIVGVVSEGDLVLKEDPYLEDDGPIFEGRRHRAKRQKAAGLVASQVMTTPAITVGPDAPLGVAARLMHARNLKRLPVVDRRGQVIGIVSRADLLKVFLREDAEIEREVMEDVIRRAMWIDPASIRVRVKEGVVSLEGQLERRSLVPVLVGLVRGVEGVVGVEERLSHQVDDTVPITTEIAYPWAGLPPRESHAR